MGVIDLVVVGPSFEPGALALEAHAVQKAILNPSHHSVVGANLAARRVRGKLRVTKARVTPAGPI